MIRLIRRISLFLAVLGAIALFAQAPLTKVNAQGLDGCKDSDPKTPCNVLDPACNNSASDVLCPENNKPQTVDSNTLFGTDGVLTKATRLLSTVIGIAAVIMIIVGGFQYVMSSGDPGNITNAKNTILYAIIGLLVAVLAQGIISFVLVRL